MSIRTRLTLVVGAILLVGFLTTNLISFRVSTATIRNTILENELPLTSNNIYTELQASLLKPILVSSMMAHDTFLKDWLLGGEKDLGSVTRYLDEIRKRYGVFTTFVISDRTKSYYHFSGFSRHIHPDDPQDSWFDRVRTMKQPYEVNVDVNQEQHKAITIFINYRLLDYDGNFLAAAGVGLNLDAVSGIIAKYSRDYRHSIYFVDPTGRIVIRSDGAPTGEDVRAAPGLSTIAARLMASDQGYYEFDRDGHTMLATMRLIPDLGWRVIVAQSEWDAFRPVWRSFLTNLLIGIVIIALTMVVVGYAINLYQARLEAMTVTDRLTGIGNRQMFEIEIENALALRRRHARPFSLIMLDIDHFKQVNDRLGHIRGDEAIRRVTAAMRRVLRRSSVICRWGGEEIIVLLHDCRLDAAVEVAERLRCAVAAEPVFEPDDGTRLTVSAGVTEAAAGEDADTVMTRADGALYWAKQTGRDRVRAAPPALPAKAAVAS